MIKPVFYIAHLVADTYDVDPDLDPAFWVVGDRTHLEARSVTMWLALEAGHSSRAVAVWFGAAHSTVLRAADRVRRAAADDALLNAQLWHLLADLNLIAAE